MQQKLNLCLGLLPDPGMLLLDEPMIGLDPHAIKQLKEMIEEMRGAGKTLLVSTHIIDSVDMLWDRTLIMQGGRIKANVTREELDRDGRTLEQLFFDVTEGTNTEDMRSGDAEALQPERMGNGNSGAAGAQTVGARNNGATETGSGTEGGSAAAERKE